MNTDVPRPERTLPCDTDGCPGDGRYAPPGRGHTADCAAAHHARLKTKVAEAMKRQSDAPRPERVRCPGCGYEDCPRPSLECGGYHRPERVTLTDEERAARRTLDAENISHWLYHNSQMMPRECDEVAAKILDSEWLAALKKALREEIAGKIEARPLAAARELGRPDGVRATLHAARIARGGTR